MRPLEMRINLSAIEHLGMNLYSTMPAVLSEIVANAWDADASEVEVRLDAEAGTISIRDDGCGMTRDEVIDQFLAVGFRRRQASGSRTTQFKRAPMGRKGIGKLSSFSIARTVTVHTSRDGDRTAFCMDAEAIRRAAQAQPPKAYQPDEIKDWPDDLNSGTRIVLGGLTRRVAGMTRKGLRQRLARRFSVIGSKHDFEVTVDGEPITPEDRGYYGNVEYLWTYGDQSEELERFSNLAQKGGHEDRTQSILDLLGLSGNPRIAITGWIGTVEKPGVLKDEGAAKGGRGEEGENLNRIAVFMRGKLAQEDVLRDFGQKEIYADYVVGEIHCDDLDRDDDEDVATSSRQSLKYDDPRFEVLRKVVHQEIRHIAKSWSDLRRKAGAENLAGKVPVVKTWLEELEGDTRKKAERWIGRLNVIRSDGDRRKRELLKASILAFESYRRKEQLDSLDGMDDQNLEPILDIFNDIDDLERSYYGQIAKLRLGVIHTLREKLDANSIEQVIQKHIYKHLWLVDPSWERARGSESMESRLGSFLKKNSSGLSSEQREARIDIGYRMAAGRHVIIELKRPSVATPVDELTRQIRKYRDGARTLIEQSDYSDWRIEIICLVGKPPPEWNGVSGKIDVEESLKAVGARLMFYQQLLDNAYLAYADYLEKHEKIDRLSKIFDAIDDFAGSDATAPAR